MGLTKVGIKHISLTIPRMAVAPILRIHQHRNRWIHTQRHNEHQPLSETVHPDLAQHRIEIGLRQRCSRLLVASRYRLDQRQLLHRVELKEGSARHADVGNNCKQQNCVANHKVHESRRFGRGAKGERKYFGERRKDAAQRLTTDHGRYVLGRELARYAEQATAENSGSN